MKYILVILPSVQQLASKKSIIPITPPIHEIGGFYFSEKMLFFRNAENKPFGLYNILSEFNICKQK